MIKNANQYNFQYDYRVDSQLKIIQLLQNESHPISYLKDKLGISFTATSNIVNQLIEYGVLVKDEEKTAETKMGRIPLSFKINTALGLTCSIDWSSNQITVSLNDLNGNIVCRRNVKNQIFIGYKELELTASLIKEMLKTEEVGNRELLGICVSCPGLINKKTEEVAVSFRYLYKENPMPSVYFYNEFGVPVHVYNDLKISCLGDMMRGNIPSTANNFCYIYFGASIGSALFLDGKLYQGSSGYSGEFSFKYSQDNAFLNKNTLIGFQELCNYVRKKDASLDFEISEFVLDLNKAQKLYDDNNEIFNEALYEMAMQHALQLIAYNDFLDFDCFFITGDINRFKDRYQEYLMENINKFTKLFKPKVYFINQCDNSLSGTIYMANRHFFLKKLESIANSNSANASYDIYDSFGDKFNSL